MKRTGLMFAVLLGSATVSLPAHAESFQEGMQLICQSPKQAKVESLRDRSKQLTTAAKWIDEHLRNREARQVFDSLPPLELVEKAAKVREAAYKAGISECPLADLWAAPSR